MVEGQARNMVDNFSALCNFLLCALVFCLHFYLREGFRSPGIEVTDSFELLCGCWELNRGSLEEHASALDH